MYKLSKSDIGSIVKVDNNCYLPADLFEEGTSLILFNNSDIEILISTSVTNSYISGRNGNNHLVIVKPRALISLLFIDVESVVFSGEIK